MKSEIRNSLIVILTWAAAASAAEFQIQPLEGPPVAGDLVSIDGKQVVLQTPTGRVTLEIEKIASLAPKQKPAAPGKEPSVWIDLVDGSTLLAEEYTARAGAARITLRGGEVIEMPSRDILTVRFQAGAEAAAAEWMRIVGNKGQSDVLVTAKGDDIDGHNGAIHDVTDKQVQFDLDGEMMNVKRAKIYGLVFHHAQQSEHSEGLYAITDAGGSRWSAECVTFAGPAPGTGSRVAGPAEKLEWKTPTGLTVRRAAEQVANIDFSRGKIVFLSDLKPESAVYTPYFSMDKELPARAELFRPRQDQTLESKPLRLAGKPYPKGLAMHARTEMKYDLPGKFRKLQAVAGIDDDFRPRGNARLVLRGDDKVLLETTILGADPPKPIDVDLTGVRRLVVLVDYGDELDVSSRLDLCNAKIIK